MSCAKVHIKEAIAMFEPEGYYVIKGRFTWTQICPVLGKSEYGLQRDTKGLMPEGGEPCGLSSSEDGLTYQIYTRWKEPEGSCVAHVVLHPDGLCFSGALRVEQDWAYAKELFVKVRSCLEQYQPMNSEVHRGEVE